ncbi:MAG: hypothetical protein A2W01_05485 [Candidatus Solincola sediminis]|uniref:Saccharopine dehydrogenase NADP binding domain-containing protein n=1 Tax=Candidatus Solincola sediminis TaxID=1797199 RepID=A0A1F2WF40_9ACTN|nr:MAG: hypothetical protein A2Y75_09005 [Candidatus Solincola sediminis]OFW57855.1 MAG: hypothetical protein A2W01_05485 [Candidatus Solincola sediminis]
MKVLVLGAAGRSGRALMPGLLALSGLDRVFLADYNAEGLGQMAGDPAISIIGPRFLDAENENSLRQRISEVDVVLGCLGPFHRHERRVIEAVIDTGRDYISLCDDPEATAYALSLNQQAEARGVTVLCGCGISPGISNLLACRVASRFKSLESLDLAWYLEPGSRLGAGALDHVIKSMSGSAPYYHHGPAKARPGSWEEYVEFPPPVGRQAVSFLGHPEPVTLPGVLTEAPEIRFKGGVGGRSTSLGLQTLAWMGGDEQSALLSMMLRTAAGRFARNESAACLSAIRVTAIGRENGREEKKILGLSGDYYHISALMMLTAIEQWRSGRLPAGVHTPEQVLDERGVFSRLRAYGLRFLAAESNTTVSSRLI